MIEDPLANIELEEYNSIHNFLSHREGSIDGEIFDSVQNVKARIKLTMKKIRTMISPTVKSIEGDIYKLNRDRVIIGMANWLASKLILH